MPAKKEAKGKDPDAKNKLAEYAEYMESHKVRVINLMHETDKLVAEIISSELSRSEKIAALESIGCYVLPDTEEPEKHPLISVDLNTIRNPLALTDSTIVPFSSSSNVVLEKPVIMYDSVPNGWIIAGGGYWKSGWDTSASVAPGGTGNYYSVGGPDGVGVGFTSVSGSYSSSIQYQNGYLSDGEGRTVETSVRSDGDGRLGFGFRMQDKTYVKGWANYTYVGKHFSASTRYDSRFSNYHGVATTYYAHTWNQTSIQSLTVGANGSGLSAQVTFSNANYGWTGYSTDTRF